MMNKTPIELATSVTYAMPIYAWLGTDLLTRSGV